MHDLSLTGCGTKIREHLGALTAGALTLAALGVFAYFATAYERFPGDATVSGHVQGWGGAGLQRAMEALSSLGYGGAVAALVAIVAVLMLLTGWKLGATATVVATLAGFGLSQGIKVLVARPRPPAELVRVLYETDGYSFPSATALVYGAFLGTALLVLARYMPGGPARTLLTVALALVALAIGFSRIYLGAHWLSDVIGGYAFGAAVAGWTAWVARRWERRQARTESRQTEPAGE